MKKSESLRKNAEGIIDLHSKIYNQGYQQGYMTAINQERNFDKKNGETKRAYNCGSVNGYTKGLDALTECIIYLEREMSTVAKVCLFDASDVATILEKHTPAAVMRMVRCRKSMMQTDE